MKTAIVYFSQHHGNTKKLIDAIAARYDVTLIDAVKEPDAKLDGYDLIGFASGIYYSKFHKSVLKLAAQPLPVRQKVFFLYTYGMKKSGYTSAVTEAVSKSTANIVGEYGCLGFNTFGPLRLFGGMAKGHPSPSETEEAVAFFERLQA